MDLLTEFIWDFYGILDLHRSEKHLSNAFFEVNASKKAFFRLLNLGLVTYNIDISYIFRKYLSVSEKQMKQDW